RHRHDSLAFASTAVPGCGQCLPNRDASSMPGAGSAGSGGRQRSTPTGRRGIWNSQESHGGRANCSVNQPARRGNNGADIRRAIGVENDRNAHEVLMRDNVRLPEGKILMPGAVGHVSNIVEHPELVAWRIRLYAERVGKENVIAGTDCGYSQGWDLRRAHP